MNIAVAIGTMVVMVAGAAAMMIAVMEMVINGNNGIGNGDNGSDMKRLTLPCFCFSCSG